MSDVLIAGAEDVELCADTNPVTAARTTASLNIIFFAVVVSQKMTVNADDNDNV